MSYLPIPINDPQFKDKFPGWAALVQVVTQKPFILQGVQRVVGVTKQQIDYWLQKGVLPSEDRISSTWRRFSILDMFMFAVAAEFKLHGLEVADIAQIRELIPVWKYADWTECFPYIINGHDVYLYSDLEHITGLIPIEDSDTSGAFPLLKLRLVKDTKFLVAVSLKKICDQLAKEVFFPHFRVNVLSDGKYEFFISEVPLKLESLERNPPKLWGRKKNRKKLRKEGKS
jgi:hypothetical protein